jgi:hypothetical protein
VFRHQRGVDAAHHDHAGALLHRLARNPFGAFDGDGHRRDAHQVALAQSV